MRVCFAARLAAYLALLLVALSAGPGRTTPVPGRATFVIAKRGMTLADVSAAGGGPPGDYRTDGSAALPHGSWRLWRHYGWVSNEVVLFVEFDDNGIAADVRVMGMEHYDRSSWWERALEQCDLSPPPAPRTPLPPGVVPPELD